MSVVTHALRKESNLNLPFVKQTTINTNQFHRKSSKNWLAMPQQRINVLSQQRSCNQSIPNVNWMFKRNYLNWSIVRMSYWQMRHSFVSTTQFPTSSNWFTHFGRVRNVNNCSFGHRRRMFGIQFWYHSWSTWLTSSFKSKMPNICRFWQRKAPARCLGR